MLTCFKDWKISQIDIYSPPTGLVSMDFPSEWTGVRYVYIFISDMEKNNTLNIA